MSDSENKIPAEPKGLRKKLWIIFLVTLALYMLPIPGDIGSGHFLLTKSIPYSWNDQARIATVESLAERQTMAIDYSRPGIMTGDKVLLREHWYSTKPPLLSAWGALGYMGLRSVIKLFTGAEITYSKNEDIIYPFVTLITSGLAFALLLTYFMRALYLIEMKESVRWWLFWALAIGSLYPAYSTVLNNHSVAGSLLFIGFFYVLKYRLGGTFVWWEAILTGFVIAFASVNDLTGALPFLPMLWILIVMKDFPISFAGRKIQPQKGSIAVLSLVIIAAILASLKIGNRGVAILMFTPAVVMFGISVYLLIRKKPASFFYMLGLAIPVIAHLYLNSKVTGNWLPTYIQSDVYIAAPPGYYGEVISPEQAGILFWERWKYIGTALFGIRGIFLYTPAILLGIIACFRSAFMKHEALRAESIMVVLGVLSGWIYLLGFETSNFGGTSYGLRYALPATPLLIFFCYKLFEWGNSKIYEVIFRNAVAWGVIAGLFAIPFPWGTGGSLPTTECSIVENAEYISYFTLLFFQ